MRLHRLFDRLDDSFGLEDRTDIAVSGYADTDRVMSIAHEKLGLRPKRSVKKKAAAVLLAAALIAAVSVLGASAIIQRLTAGEVFSEVFSGEPDAAGLYESRSVRFTSPDESLSADVLGMTADNHDLYAMLSVRHKDGSAFADEDHRYGVYIPTSGTFDEFGGIVSCTMENGEPLGNLGFGGGFDCRCYLSGDRKEMKIYLSVDLNGLDAKGGELTFTSRRFIAQKITEIRSSYDVVTNRDWLEVAELIDKEGWRFIRMDEGYVLCKTEKKEFELPFELSFSLDYETGNNIWLHPSRMGTADILTPAASGMTAEISDLGIELDSDCSAGAAGIGKPGGEESVGVHFYAFRETDSTNSYVTLDDGTSYYLVLSGFDGGLNEDTGRYEEKIHLRYKNVPDPALADEMAVIDKSKISRIVINGDTIYEKGGNENVAQADIS